MPKPTETPLPPAGEYIVSFDNKTTPGYIRAVKVRLSEDIVDLDEKVRIDLRDHPLYKHLHRYCADNPPVK